MPTVHTSTAWATGTKTGSGATITTSNVTGASNRARNVILVYSSCWDPFPETQWLRNKGGSGHLLSHCRFAALSISERILDEVEAHEQRLHKVKESNRAF